MTWSWLCLPSTALAQVTVQLDKDAYTEGERMWVTVTVPDGRQLKAPRIDSTGTGRPPPAESTLWQEFPPITGTRRLSVHAPGFVSGVLADGAPFVLGPGDWDLYLFDGRSLVAKVPFRMLAANGGTESVSGGPRTAPSEATVTMVAPRVLTHGAGFDVNVSLPANVPAGTRRLRWAPATIAGAPSPASAPPGAFPEPFDLTSAALSQTVEVFAPYASGRFELRLELNGEVTAVLQVTVK